MGKATGGSGPGARPRQGRGCAATKKPGIYPARVSPTSARTAYVPQHLLELWEKGKPTVEMAIGHILRHLLNHEERLRRLERQAEQPPSSDS